MFYKKGFLKISQNLQEKTCVGVSFLLGTPAEVFSCELCEIFNNTCFTEHLRTTDSEYEKLLS